MDAEGFVVSYDPDMDISIPTVIDVRSLRVRQVFRGSPAIPAAKEEQKRECAA